MRRIPTFIICLCLFIVFIAPPKAFAGFPIGKYRNIVVPSFSYYRQTDRFDQNGNMIKGMPGVGFSSYSGNLYVGYGISRRLDLIVSLPFLYQVNNLGAGNSITNQGAGDLVAGLSYNLANFNYVRFLSVQVSGVAPLYTNIGSNPALGLGDYGSEIKLMYCGSLPKSIADKGYFNTEIAYRRYFSYQGPDQVSFLATVGYPISWHNQLSLDLLFFRSFSSNKTYNSNIFAERNYAFFKPQLNFGHQFTRRFSMFIGGFYVPFGLNTGVGYGGSVVTIFKL
jgi:protein XagA